MDYKGYTIEISVFPDLLKQTFHATYTIRKGQASAIAGSVAGGHKTMEDAQRAAERAARRLVDAQS